MAKTTLQTAIMFSDVAGSSALYKKLGDTEANEAVSKCVNLMMEEVEGHQGIVIKTIGDEVMARFDSAANACLAAVDIQRRSKRELDLAIRIGMDYGTAIFEGNDVFGQVVNDAAAVSHIAQAQQIVITQVFFEDLPKDPPYGVKLYDTIKLKGSPRETNIYRVAWEEEEKKATEFFNIEDLDPAILQQLAKPVLKLGCRETFVDVTEEDTPFIVGRDTGSGCNLIVNSNFASRDHLHILFRRGKFILVDHSTNGTYVSIKDSAPIYLRREEYPLTESGRISLGKQLDPADENVLTFRI